MKENEEILKNEEVEEAKRAAGIEDEENAEEAVTAEEESELDKALAYAEDCKRKWYSVAAEYDNYRKRNAQAVSKSYQEGVSDAVLKLLPVADTFGYALDSASDEKTKAGIDKVIKSFNTILSSLGVEEIIINAGDDFDESVAEAVMSFPCEEGEKPNVVKRVLKKGYRNEDKVIRFAQVTVTV